MPYCGGSSGICGSPDADGAWILAISFPEEYPLRSPEIRFITPILHCNVNSHGKICHSIFDRNYNADTSMTTMLSCVYGLLLTPDKHDPVDSTLALSANNDSGEYEGAIMAHCLIHASTPRTALVAQLADVDEGQSDLGRDRDLCDGAKVQVIHGL